MLLEFVLILSMKGFDGSVAVEHIPEFQNRQQCETAGSTWVNENSGRSTKAGSALPNAYLTYTCVERKRFPFTREELDLAGDGK